MSDVVRFLETVYGHGSGWVHLTATKRQLAAVKCADVADLAEKIEGRKDVFLSAAVIETERGTGINGRIEDTDAVQLTAVWVDLDREGEPGHKTKGPHWSRSDMAELLDYLPIQPTAIVDSGGGWWTWFVLDEPIPVNGDGSGELLLARWRGYWEGIGEKFGRHVDLGVWNAGRIARAPGSINNKENIPRPAVVKSVFPERRYSQADLEAFLPFPKPNPTPSYNWDGIGERPGDVYNREATPETTVALLERHGFHSPKRVGRRIDLTRPGKNGREGSSASVYPDAGVTFFSSSPEGLPGAVELRDKGGARGSYDPFGFYAAVEHNGDFEAAARALNPEGKVKVPKSDSEPGEEEPGRYVEPVDLEALMDADPPEEDWCIEPILPARKHTGIVATRGHGKSLVALDIAARKATGQATLSQPEGDPAHVVYLDQEMGPDDLYERLADLGWTTDNPDFPKLVEHLHYYQLVDLPPLDTEDGGRELEAIVDRHQAELVVIDTVSRVISGDENSSDTFRELFRHTETRLKRRGVTLARLDHLGKDVTKGSRGASGKEDALDVVWQLSQSATGSLTLKLTKGRQAWIPTHVTIHRDNWNGTLAHTIRDEPAPSWLTDLVDLIDSFGIPQDAGIPTVQKTLRDEGQGRRRTDIAKAVKFRKGRAAAGTDTGNTPGTPYGNTSRNTPEHPPPKTHTDQELFNREHPREHPGTGKGVGSPPLGGNTPTHSDVSAETDRIAGL